MQDSLILKVQAGKISSAALGASKLGSSGVSVKKVIDQINKITQQDAGMKVLIKIEILSKSGDYKIVWPDQHITYKILKLVGSKKGSTAGQKIGCLNNLQIQKLIQNNYNENKYNSKQQMKKQVKGTCKTLGVIISD